MYDASLFRRFSASIGKALERTRFRRLNTDLSQIETSAFFNFRRCVKSRRPKKDAQHSLLGEVRLPPAHDFRKGAMGPGGGPIWLIWRAGS
jgi:hypothetical protein